MGLYGSLYWAYNGGVPVRIGLRGHQLLLLLIGVNASEDHIPNAVALHYPFAAAVWARPVVVQAYVHYGSLSGIGLLCTHRDLRTRRARLLQPHARGRDIGETAGLEGSPEG